MFIFQLKINEKGQLKHLIEFIENYNGENVGSWPIQKCYKYRMGEREREREYAHAHMVL